MPPWLPFLHATFVQRKNRNCVKDGSTLEKGTRFEPAKPPQVGANARYDGGSSRHVRHMVSMWPARPNCGCGAGTRTVGLRLCTQTSSGDRGRGWAQTHVTGKHRERKELHAFKVGEESVRILRKAVLVFAGDADAGGRSVSCSMHVTVICRRESDSSIASLLIN